MIGEVVRAKALAQVLRGRHGHRRVGEPGRPGGAAERPGADGPSRPEPAAYPLSEHPSVAGWSRGCRRVRVRATSANTVTLRDPGRSDEGWTVVTHLGDAGPDGPDRPRTAGLRDGSGRLRLPAAAARADHLPRLRGRGHRTPTRSARSCCCSPPRTPTRDIFLYINSPGGSVDAGMAIYDTMQFVPNDVATVAMGLAASMGQFLLCAGAKGKRYALPHARIMMHQPSGGIGGTASDIKIQAEQMLLHQEGAGRADRRAHRPDASSRSRPTPTATAGSPPRRRKEYGFVDHVVTQRPRGRRRAAPAPEPTARPQTDTPWTSARSCRPDRRRRPLHPAEVRRAHGARLPRVQPVHEAVRGAHHLPRRPDRRRVARTTSWRSCSCLESMDPDRDIPIYINSPGGSFTAHDGDLRHDAVRQARHPDGLPRPGRLGGRGAARRRHPGKRFALPHSPDPDPPAVHRGRRPGLGHRDPGQRDPADARAELEDMLAQHTGRDRRAGPAATSSATRSSPRTRPWSTASSTR